MAENLPTNNTAGAPEEKPVSSVGSPAHPTLLEDLIFSVIWTWKILLALLALLPSFWKWFRQNPLGGLSIFGIVATLVYFFGFFHPFNYGAISTARWAWDAWQPDGPQAHGRLVLFITLGLIFHHRERLKNVSKSASLAGLLTLAVGILIFVCSVRCLNPRMALASVPFLIFGSTQFVWGTATARVILFPCAFLVFMIPVAALEQATNSLQFIITGVVAALAHLLHIGLLDNGTTLTPTDGSFHFEIAEGCSGIRSITAMTMLTAAYVHLTQDRFWKKLIIFCCSIVFAIVGNIGRIFTIVLVARFYDPQKAAGIYHEYSGYLFFPIAIAAMLFFARIVNLDYRKLAVKAEATAKAMEKKPVSYDY